MRFAKRMDKFSEGVFAQLHAIKNNRVLEGKLVVDLSIGTPNIPPAKHIIEALNTSVLNTENYVYAISDTEALQDAAATWYKRRYGIDLNPRTEIASLLGSQEGLAHIALMLADEGDYVLVPDPCYPVFSDGPLLAGAKVHYMEQKKENNFLIDFNDIPTEVAKKAKLITISYPNNPTTVLAPDSFYHELIAFAKEFDIAVLHDNAYSELVYDGKETGSFLRFDGARDVGVEFNSLSKTYGMAGARIGFCVGNEDMVRNLKKLKSSMDYGIFLPLQRAAIAAITGDQSCVETTRNAYQKRRDVLCTSFDKIGWHIDKCEATMFLWAKIPEKFKTSQEFAMRLVEETGVIVTPGSAFGEHGEGYVRIALVQDEYKILQAASSIESSGILG